jgi:hypothetical protein
VGSWPEGPCRAFARLTGGAESSGTKKSGSRSTLGSTRYRSGETGWAGKAYIGCCKVAPSAAAQPAAKAQYSYPVNLDPNGDNWLALRTEPRGVRIMKMGPDTLFTVVGEQGDWAHIRLPTGETGWAGKAYIGCCVTAPGDRL